MSLTFLSSLKAGIISGKITDENGDPLPFATLYVEGTTKGTTTNTDGDYSFYLDPGQYTLVYQFVGYQNETRVVTVTNKEIVLNVKLKAEVLTLNEIVISSDEEDPAYPVIRNAMKNRKRYRDEINAFKCDVYVKGLQMLDKKPNNTFGINLPFDSGIVYLSESISQLSIERPDKVKEIMISSKVSGKNSAFSYNQGSQMLVSFYDNLFKIEGITQRGFVSPIASDALLFYKYRLVGTRMEGNRMINKIEVIPIRKNDPVFAGHIYIIENEWRIHSLELTVTRERQLEFMDQLTVSQVYAPINDHNWMVFSQQFTFDLNVFGFKGTGYFIGVYSNYQIELNPEYRSVHNTASDSVTVDDLFSDKYFSSEVMRIEDGSNERDSMYWVRNRPIPLTKIEAYDYRVKDSIRNVMSSRAFMDSLDKRTNKLKLGNIFVSGYTYNKTYEGKAFKVDPLVKSLQYNTVEGLVTNLKFQYHHFDKEVSKFRLTPEIRYGFASEQPYGQISAKWYISPVKFTRIEALGGHFVRQYNDENPILPLVNSLETIINRRNYMKIYEDTYVGLNFEHEITNGVHFRARLKYAQRSELENKDDFSDVYDVIYQSDRPLTDNRPANLELDDTSFDRHEALTLKIRFYIKFKQTYITRPDQKFTIDSNWPRIKFFYHKGIPAFNSDVNFDEFSFIVRQNFPLGLIGNGAYSLQYGNFLNNSDMTLIDYRHFMTIRSSYARFRPARYYLLDYYLYSTKGQWIQAHYDHHFDGFIINKIPFLKKSKVQTVASIHFLHTQEADAYVEFGMGLEHIFKMGRFDFYTALLEGEHYESGFRFGLGL